MKVINDQLDFSKHFMNVRYNGNRKQAYCDESLRGTEEIDTYRLLNVQSYNY